MADDVEVLRTPQSVEALREEWAALCQQAGSSPLLHPSYALCWWERLGRGELMVVCVRRDRDLVALAPLHLRRVAGLEVVRWLGHGLGTVAEIITRPGREDAAAAVWPALRAPGRVLQLLEYHDDGAGLLALRRDRDWRVQIEVRNRCPVVDLRAVTDIRGLPDGRATRKVLRRSQRTLTEMGSSHQVEVVTTAAGLHEVLPDLVRVAAASAAHTPRLNLLAAPWLDFTTDLLETFARSDGMVVLVGRLDGRVCSASLALRSGAHAAYWVTCFDPQVSAINPGHLLLQGLLGWANVVGIEHADLLLGDQQYKRHWANAGYDTLGVLAAAPGDFVRARRVLATAEWVRGSAATARQLLSSRSRGPDRVRC